MKLYNKYIFDRTSRVFFAILILLVTLIWFSKTITFVKYITENGIELSQFLFLFILILPWLLLFIIPISLFVAILFIFNRLIANNEITILKNAGLSNIKIARSVISIAIYATIFCFVISLFLMPYSNKKLRLVRSDFENNYSNIGFSEGVFESLKSLTIYTKEKNKNNQLFGILLHDERNEQYSMTITAESGNLSFENNKLLLYMKDGTAQRFDRATYKSEILTFDDYVFNLSDNSTDEEKTMKWKAKERYVHELINPKDDLNEVNIAKYRAELQQRITCPLMSITMALIALSVILSGSFNRRENSINIVTASVLAIVFLTNTMIVYRLIETKFYLTPLLYLNFIFFIGLSIKLLLPKKSLYLRND